MSNIAVITFGRMNPITIGHERLVNKVTNFAKTVGGTPLLFLSHSVDKKNPLDYLTKCMLAQKAFPNVHVQITESRTLIAVMQELAKHYTDVIFFVGDEDHPHGGRMSDNYNTMLQKYNGQDYNLDSITVIPVMRDFDSKGVEGMRATNMRKAAKNQDYATFFSGMPENLKPYSKFIMQSVRKGMELNED